jgi:hypothetical protein
MLYRQLPGKTAQNGQDFTSVRAGFMAKVLAAAPLLQVAQFYQFSGDISRVKLNSGASGGRSRAPGNPYPDNPATPTYTNLIPVPFGDKVQTDAIYEQASADLYSVRVDDLLTFATDFGYNFQYALVNFNSTTPVGDEPPQFDGILKCIPAAQITGFGAVLNTEANCDKLVYEVIMPLAGTIPGGPNFMMMDSGCLARLSRYRSKYVTYGNTPYGQFIGDINGIPIIPAGNQSTTNGGAKTLPFAAGVPTSIIMGRFSEKSDLTISTWVGHEIKDLGLVDNFYTTHVEGGFAPGLLNAKSCVLINDIQFA